jgi:hypothetical protein
MRKLKYIILLFLFVILEAKAQKNKYENFYGNEEINYSVYSNQVAKSLDLLKNYFETNKITLTTYSQNNGLYEYRFNIPKSLTASLDSLVNLLGFRASKSIQTGNKEKVSIMELATNINHLEDKKKEYKKLLSQMDSVNGKNYLYYFEKVIDLDDQLYKENVILKKVTESEKLQTVEINLHDDYATSPYSDVMFVHMPGAEANFLFVENPASGVSAAVYQGYSLKYLFTRGKSYFSVGALKPTAGLTKSDSSAVKDIFSLSFGQDFYNRHLGRGKRKFLNLYIGYHVGVSNARSSNTDKVFAYVSPVTGLELFKNKYFNLDVNAGYFIPLNDYSYTLRGIKANASLNFSF